MASIQESGFAFTPVVPQLTQEPVLRGLQFGQNPVQIQGTSAWRMPAHPSLTEGIATGLAAATKGIYAEYKEKKATELTAKEKEIKDKLERDKLTETKRHNEAIEGVKARLPQANADNFDDAQSTPPETSFTPPVKATSPAKASFTPLTAVEKSLKDNRDRADQRADQFSAQGIIPKAFSMGEQPSGVVGEPTLITGAETPVAAIPTAEVVRAAEPTKTLSSGPIPLFEAPAPERKMKFSDTKEGRKQANDFIDNYQKTNPLAPIQPKGLKIVNATKEHPAYVEVEWDVTGETARKKSKLQDSESYKKSTVANREAAAVNNDPAVKTYRGPNGFASTIVPFINAYESIAKNKEAAGTADVDLIDAYARAMAGGRVTETQFHAIQNARSLKDKITALFGKQFGGDVLSQPQRDQMMRVMLESHNAAAERANGVYDVARRRMLKQGVTDEDYLPQPHYAHAELKKDVGNKLDVINGSVAQMKQQRYQMKASGADTSKIEAEIERQAQEYARLKSEYDKEKGPVMGFDKIKDPHQGFLGGGGMMFMQPTQSEQSFE